jgi:predicted phage terminase large subunit-like protein
MAKQIRLHPAQKDFLTSKALYRSFVGGIGSGKSWAGSYDLIKRSKPSRLYMVVAPTYSMLQDSTFRSFCAVAAELGVVTPKDIRKGAPPTVKLQTGAEVIFRSGDDPDHLYGPNLSGIWLDECSLMAVDVFNVGIGRLREGGEQGWLSATFTPKGLSHWTYQVFATGRPNTAMFSCRTADNPFLPEDFHETVAGQYTSRLALQELEGRFVETEGGLFRREWFKVVDAAPKLTAKVRAWDLASTPKEKKSQDPDWSVGALLGKDEAGDIHILNIVRLRGSPQQVEAAVRSTAELDGKDTAIWMEEEGGSSGKTVIDHYVRRVLAGFNFRAERSTGDKATRAMPLAAASERGLVKVVRAHWNADLLDEFGAFPYGGHDDIVDSCSLAFNKLANKQQMWIRMGGVTFDYSTGEVVGRSGGPKAFKTAEELFAYMEREGLNKEKPVDPNVDQFGYHSDVMPITGSKRISRAEDERVW